MEYSDFLDKHSGGKILVCGCGKSMDLLNNPADFVTLGVNDIGRKFTPNYLVLLNNQHGYKGDRWQYVYGAKAPVIFTHMRDLNIIAKNNIVQIKLGTFGSLNLEDRTKVDYTSNSPYVATIIAYHMGAKNIGILGVDFTNDHFFEKTGKHPLAGRLTVIVREYDTLHKELKKRGVNLYNLSPDSIIKSVPYKSITDFQNGL
jgi:hypothetical protein